MSARDPAAGLVRLAHLAETSRWSADEAIDWSASIALTEGLPLATYVDMVSQLYHSEVATLEVLRRMIAGLPGTNTQACLEHQLREEALHAAVYRRYLERVGDVVPMNVGLAAVFDAAFEYRGPAFGWVVALNLVMEHEALRQQRMRVDRLPCPLFRQVNQRIMRDEARHAAFGFLYLRSILPSTPRAERDEVLAWVRSLWGLWADANKSRYLLDGEAVLRLDSTALPARKAALTRAMQMVGLVDDAQAL